MATLCCYPSRHPLGASFSVKGGDASNAGVLREHPHFFGSWVKSALDASFAPVMLGMDLPVRSIHTPIGRHSLPPIFLSAFEALVLRVPSLMDVCRNQAGKTCQDQQC